MCIRDRVPYGHFYALFAVTCLMPWVRDYEGSLKSPTTPKRAKSRRTAPAMSN